MPDSGLYIQDLPHINLKTADAIVTDQESGTELLQKKINVAGAYLVNDLKTRLSPVFIQRSVIQNQVAGFYQENKQSDPAIANTLKGIQLRMIQYPYIDIFISSVSLFLNHSGVVPVLVYDLIQGKLLDTINVTAVAGETVQLNIYKKYKTNGQELNLFIGYDSTGIDAYRSYIYAQGYNGCRSCPGPTSYSNKYIWGWSKSLPAASQPLQNNLTSLNTTGGLSITYTLSCSEESFICQMKDKFAFALWHRAGMEVLREALISNRMNTIIMLQKDEMQTLADFFESEYLKAMDSVLRNLKFPRDICFTCNNVVSTGIVGP